MPRFVMMCVDKPESLALRMATREDHLAYVRANGEGLRAAGPMLDDEGRMCGSLFLIEAEDAAAVRALNAADPYARAGLFERVDVFAWRQTVGEPL